MKSLFFFIYVVFFCGLFPDHKADELSSATVHKYFNDIKNNYNKLIFPKYESYSQLRIQISFQLISINGFDEVSGILELVGKLKIVWPDQNLRELYIPSSYGDISQILVPQNEVWLPTITVYNSVESLKMVGDTSYHVTIMPSSGYLSWVPGVITRTGCTVDATFFPFDKQTCEITFAAWGYKSSEVYMYSRDETVDLGIYNRNEQWEIDASSVYNSSKGGQNFFTYKLTLARQPMWFLVNMILPVVVISILTSLVFLMPVDCGERIGYIITAFLTFAFFLDMISSKLPQTSNPMAFICYFLTVMLYLSSVSTIFIIISMRVYDKPSEAEVPTWLKVVVAIIMLRFCCRKKKETSEEEETGDADKDFDDGGKDNVNDSNNEDQLPPSLRIIASLPPSSNRLPSLGLSKKPHELKTVDEKQEKINESTDNKQIKAVNDRTKSSASMIDEQTTSSNKSTDDTNSADLKDDIRKRGKSAGVEDDKQKLLDKEEDNTNATESNDIDRKREKSNASIDKSDKHDSQTTDQENGDKDTSRSKINEKEKPVEYYGPLEKISYRLVGLALDILFFLFFLFVNMICSIVFLLPLATGDKL